MKPAIIAMRRRDPRTSRITILCSEVRAMPLRALNEGRSTVKAVKWIAAMGIATTLAACAIGPTYERPTVELPQAWGDTPANGKPVLSERWWMLYGDRRLDALVEEALAHNQDIALAV